LGVFDLTAKQNSTALNTRFTNVTVFTLNFWMVLSSEIPGKFVNVVLEISLTDRVRYEEVLQTVW